MSAVVSGKLVVLTGTFSGLSRADAEAKLAALGAVIGKSLTRKTEILIYGEKAGSKLAQAQRDGIASYDEAWLLDVLAGGDGAGAERPALTGPLHDYVDRVVAWAEQLRANPSLRVGLCRAPAVSADRLDRLAKAWGFEAFSPAITNFYQQSDGLFLFWADKNHPEYAERWDPSYPYYKLHYFDDLSRQPVGVLGRMPSTYEIESFPWETGGIFWILPAADALKVSEGYYSFAYDVIDADEERQAYGRTWRGESLERAVRVFEASLQYYPVGFLMDPAQVDPPVLLGDDHGACWTDSRVATFESYLEGMFNQHFTMAARRSMVMGHNPRSVNVMAVAPPIDIATLLHAPPEAPKIEGSAFTLKVLEVERLEGEEARAYQLRAAYKYRFAAMKRVLGLKVSANDEQAFAQALAQATSDFKAIDSATAGRLATAISLKEKTKKAVAAALFVSETPQSIERVRLSVETHFKLAPYRPKRADARAWLEGMIGRCAEQVARERLPPEALQRLRQVDIGGRASITVELEALIAGSAGLSGQTYESAVLPEMPTLD